MVTTQSYEKLSANKGKIILKGKNINEITVL